MCKLIETPVFLLPESQSISISAFENQCDVQYFQLEIGLELLCQNTLVFPVANEDGNITYRMIASPNAEKFHCADCINFRAKETLCGLNSCDELLEQITRCYCESTLSLLPDNLQFELFDYAPYLMSGSQTNMVLCGKYIRYRCPYVNCYKYGFPIYVNNTVIAVLFVGQFNIDAEKNEKNSDSQKTLQDAKEFSQFDVMNRNFGCHNFQTLDELDQFVRQKLLPIVNELTIKGQETCKKKQIKLLSGIIGNCTQKFETSFFQFINELSHGVPQENYQVTIPNRFWAIVRDDLQQYFEEVGIDDFYIFMCSPSDNQNLTSEIPGISLYKNIAESKSVAYRFSAAKQMANKPVIRSIDFGQDRSGSYLFNYIVSENIFDSLYADILMNVSTIPSFAFVYSFKTDSQICLSSFFRSNILEQLNVFFQKVGQMFTSLFVRISEFNTLTVLRIYRHEITHQISALDQDIWEIEPARFLKLDENKIRNIISDHRQCLFELDFMTQNMDVITGRIKDRVLQFNCEREIDVSAELFNKIISLYQRKKDEKALWFNIQNRSRNRFVVGCLELLDIIYFNLMSNALKYAYSGTKVVLACDDTDHYSRPYKLSVTDYGVGIDAENQDQIFQIYYRGIHSKEADGSGIGLYIAKTVANLLNATITWQCDKLSDYNIPILARFVQLPENEQTELLVDSSEAKTEYLRLCNTYNLTTILNDNYYLPPQRDVSMWSQAEIKGRIHNATYKVTFELNF